MKKKDENIIIRQTKKRGAFMEKNKQKKNLDFFVKICYYYSRKKIRLLKEGAVVKLPLQPLPLRVLSDF